MPEENTSKGISLHLQTATVVTLVLAIVGWGFSIETRMSSVEDAHQLSQRVATLENALVPIIIEFKVQQELGALKEAPPAPSPVPMAPAFPPITSEPIEKNIRGKYNEDWVRENVLQQRKEP